MKSYKRILIILGCIFTGLYLLIITVLYFQQERLLFPGSKLSQSYQFEYLEDFEELNIPVDDEATINGLLFKAENAKGLVFYLHGNGGCLKTWGDIANTYTNLGYDIFIPDYRGYGKSTGDIENENQFFEDMRKVYTKLLKRYNEDEVIIIGYSIGTGAATMLAAENNPKKLILKAPYYSLTKVVNNKVPFMPDFLLKYKFETYKYLPKVNAPVYMFHGTNDRIIPYSNSLELKEIPDISVKIELITLKDEGHQVGYNKVYLNKLAEILK
ncbi:alpha/beta hydrolase [Flavobacterium suaedae]|uniref:Alpha/beta hydrolase n=1 Tax=Flavobacterium suaedae TaxID=1767027 RepID=A0ABQ1JV95_9FLAO|nr:alpha/beta fold hydrolase [Flavobacterium suaedae]GGB75435.1 alpha/beta hydrolase [Flavobacterium suaedae]